MPFSVPDYPPEEVKEIQIGAALIGNVPRCLIDQERLYTEDDVCRLMAVDIETLAEWRKAWVGPSWTVIPRLRNADREVRYHGSSLARWLTPDDPLRKKA